MRKGREGGVSGSSYLSSVLHVNLFAFSELGQFSSLETASFRKGTFDSRRQQTFLPDVQEIVSYPEIQFAEPARI